MSQIVKSVCNLQGIQEHVYNCTLYNIPILQTVITFHTLELSFQEGKNMIVGGASAISAVCRRCGRCGRAGGEGGREMWEGGRCGRVGDATESGIHNSRKTPTADDLHQNFPRESSTTFEAFFPRARRTKISRRNVKTFTAADNISTYIHLPIKLFCIGAKHSIRFKK